MVEGCFEGCFLRCFKKFKNNFKKALDWFVLLVIIRRSLVEGILRLQLSDKLGTIDFGFVFMLK